jgi:hypothetical protein
MHKQNKILNQLIIIKLLKQLKRMTRKLIKINNKSICINLSKLIKFKHKAEKHKLSQENQLPKRFPFLFQKEGRSKK